MAGASLGRSLFIHPLLDDGESAVTIYNFAELFMLGFIAVGVLRIYQTLKDKP